MWSRVLSVATSLLVLTGTMQAQFVRDKNVLRAPTVLESVKFGPPPLTKTSVGGLTTGVVYFDLRAVSYENSYTILHYNSEVIVRRMGVPDGRYSVKLELFRMSSPLPVTLTVGESSCTLPPDNATSIHLSTPTTCEFLYSISAGQPKLWMLRMPTWAYLQAITVSRLSF